MNCRCWRRIAPRLRKQAISIKGRAENHDDLAFGTRSSQDFLEAVPYLWTSQTGPIPNVSASATVDASFTTRSVPGSMPKRYLHGSTCAELRNCTNLFCGLAANFVERRCRNERRLFRCLGMDHYNDIAAVALSGQQKITSLAPPVVANHEQSIW